LEQSRAQPVNLQSQLQINLPTEPLPQNVMTSQPLPEIISNHNLPNVDSLLKNI
jgi:hypothetical protein